MADNALMSFLQDTFTRTADPSPERSKTSNLKQTNYVPEAVSDVAQRIATNPAVLKSALVHMPEVIGASALNTLAVQPAVEAGRNAKFIADYASSPASFAKVLGHQEDGTPILDDPSKPLPPSDQNVSQLALDVGMAGLGTSFAGGAPRGAIGMFAGPKSKSWGGRGLDDLYSLIEKNHNISPSAQFKKTGYFIDEQNWQPIKMIIPENSAMYDTTNMNRVMNNNAAVNAVDVLKYPELFKEYPDLADIKVRSYYNPEELGGAYFDQSRWEVGINNNNPVAAGLVTPKEYKDMVQTLSHEIAGHGVDALERRPYRGSNYDVEKDMLQWAQEHYHNVENKINKFVDNNSADKDNLAWHLYELNPGEVTAELAGDIASSEVVRRNAVRIPNHKEAAFQEYERLKAALGLPGIYGKR